MYKKIAQLLCLVLLLMLAFGAGVILSQSSAGAISSAVVIAKNAKADKAEWGTFYTYYEGETYGTRDLLNGVAIIDAGQEIHPPHQHAEEEFLMVTEGQGTWHLNGKTFAANAGDILYAAPWDIHGIKNTGKTALKFVVWKWNNKGVPPPAQSSEKQ